MDKYLIQTCDTSGELLKWLNQHPNLTIISILDCHPSYEKRIIYINPDYSKDGGCNHEWLVYSDLTAPYKRCLKCGKQDFIGFMPGY